jgi:hypothetical protein
VCRDVAVMIGLRDLRGVGHSSGGQKQGNPRVLAGRVERDPITERGERLFTLYMITVLMTSGRPENVPYEFRLPTYVCIRLKGYSMNESAIVCVQC